MSKSKHDTAVEAWDTDATVALHRFLERIPDASEQDRAGLIDLSRRAVALMRSHPTAPSEFAGLVERRLKSLRDGLVDVIPVGKDDPDTVKMCVGFFRRMIDNELAGLAKCEPAPVEQADRFRPLEIAALDAMGWLQARLAEKRAAPAVANGISECVDRIWSLVSDTAKDRWPCHPPGVESPVEAVVIDHDPVQEAERVATERPDAEGADLERDDADSGVFQCSEPAIFREVRMASVGLDAPELCEELAELAHKQWSGWMEYMLPRLLEPEHLMRWKRQMVTPYADLHHKEQESDRKEAARVLAVLRKHARGGLEVSDEV